MAAPHASILSPARTLQRAWSGQVALQYSCKLTCPSSMLCNELPACLLDDSYHYTLPTKGFRARSASPSSQSLAGRLHHASTPISPVPSCHTGSKRAVKSKARYEYGMRHKMNGQVIKTIMMHAPRLLRIESRLRDCLAHVAGYSTLSK